MRAVCGLLTDLLGTVLRRRQPVPSSADLLAARRQQVPRQTPYRDAAPSLLHRRQRLQQHACRSVAAVAVFAGA